MPSAAIVATPVGGVVLVVIPTLPVGRAPAKVRKSGWIVPRWNWPHWLTLLVLAKSLSRAMAAPVVGSVRGRPFHGAGRLRLTRRSAFFAQLRSWAARA